MSYKEQKAAQMSGLFLLLRHSGVGRHSRHSGGNRNPVKLNIWTPAFAGVTASLSFNPNLIQSGTVLPAEDPIETLNGCYNISYNSTFSGGAA